MRTSSFRPDAGAEPIPGYRLIDLLGEGGFGQVWKAMAPGGFLVALKFVGLGGDAGPVEERALEMIRQVRHPNLVGTFGAWQIPGYLVIAMELADRTLLDRYREAAGEGLVGIPRDELLEYLREAAKGIDYLNEPWTDSDGKVRPAIQHRDIKPQNILLVGNGVKVADFGLARVMEHAITSHTGRMTPAYAAPEFFQGKTASQSDQYSLAVAYCHLRGGRLPFSGDMMQLMLGHIQQTPALDMLPEPERPVVARALAKQPAQRWPSCRAFVEALQTAAVPAMPKARADAGRLGALSGSQVRASAFPSRGHPRPAAGHKLDTFHLGDLSTRHTRDPAQAAGSSPGSPRHWKTFGQHKLWWGGAGVLAACGLAALLLWQLTRHAGPMPDTTQSEFSARASAPPTQGRDVLRQDFPAIVKAGRPMKALPDPVALSPAETEFTNSIGMRLVRIPPGTFFMGASDDDRDMASDEIPWHEVEITRAFYLGKYEVTRGQFRTFVEETAYRSEAERDGLGGQGYDVASGRFKGPTYNSKIKQVAGQRTRYTWRDCGVEQTDEHPVVNVSWNDAQAFCAWLGQKEGRPYRLPTEAEWEYACRAGTTTRFYSGDDPESLAQVGNVADASYRRKFPKRKAIGADDGYIFTAPVGKYEANAFRLYDMHGNVWEWCSDWYDQGYYKYKLRRDPTGSESGEYRVMRGGSWTVEPRLCRAAFRSGLAPSSRLMHVGFRVACIR